ncbi:hypothetical protein ACI65C_006556 [Semiaphis heraclei]
MKQKKVEKPKSGSSQDGLEKYYGKWSYFVSMQFLKDVETPRITLDSNEDDENEENLDKETPNNVEGMDSLIPQTESHTNLTQSARNSPISELNNSTNKSVHVQPIQSSQPMPFQPIHHPMQSLATEQSLLLQPDHPSNYN